MDRVLDYRAIRRAAADLVIAVLPEITPAYDLLSVP
jgi:hypothetical protein